eukprot:TRINITY_DN6167_c0_g1_i1.p1 TRINITY_DN6167_c0_g1~~TRINITY_DN6167_c0_g1_i1.p1  ORF type:complete len:259 (-),score=60.86 TRINITY_DN6167_c0_g1_i1:19-795(-)
MPGIESDISTLKDFLNQRRVSDGLRGMLRKNLEELQEEQKKSQNNSKRKRSDGNLSHDISQILEDVQRTKSATKEQQTTLATLLQQWNNQSSKNDRPGVFLCDEEGCKTVMDLMIAVQTTVPVQLFRAHVVYKEIGKSYDMDEDNDPFGDGTFEGLPEAEDMEMEVAKRKFEVEDVVPIGQKYGDVGKLTFKLEDIMQKDFYEGQEPDSRDFDGLYAVQLVHRYENTAIVMIRNKSGPVKAAASTKEQPAKKQKQRQA